MSTTPGVEYFLTYWTAVNGDQVPNQAHTMDVIVGGVTVATVQALSAGAPLQWVLQTTTVTATSSLIAGQFDDATVGDVIDALDNVSMTAIPDVITAAPATVAPQTTANAFTVPVATFTDSYLGSPGNFSASIGWGDTTTSAGTITESGSTFTVNGTHTYAAHGTYTPTVTITSIAGATASVSDSVSRRRRGDHLLRIGLHGDGQDAPADRAGSTRRRPSGTILTDIDPASNRPRRAETRSGTHLRSSGSTDTALNANIVYTVTFANKSAAGSWLVPFAVCYQAETPFKDLYGHTVTTGLLPLCTLIPRPSKPLVAPCVQSITELPLYVGNVVEKIVVPPGDPKGH